MKRIVSLLLVVIMALTFSLATIAADSTEDPGTDKVVSVGHTEGGNCEFSFEDGGIIRLVASQSTGSKFTGWVIDGDYEIISGDLQSPELVIKVFKDSTKTPSTLATDGSVVFGNLVAKATFDNNTTVINTVAVKGSSGTGTTPESPKTGYSVLPIACVIALAACGFTYSVKRAHNA